jgi:hypothetical protein
MPTLTQKRGDTFRWALSHFDGAAVQPLTGWTIASQVRTAADTVVATLTVSNRDDAAGLFVLSATETATWPVGKLLCDIQYTDASGVIRSTQTIEIACVLDITRQA